MMRNSLFALLFLGTLLMGCDGDPNFSNTPEIEFSNIVIVDYPAVPEFADSVIISVDFKDGNGDMGLNVADTANELYKPRIIDNNGDTVNNPFTNNYFLSIIRRSGAAFDTVIVPAFRDPDAFNFDSRYPRIGDGTGAIEGRLDFGFFVPYRKNGSGIFASPFDFGDTVFFEIQLADRALNLSNFATSTEVVLGSPD